MCRPKMFFILFLALLKGISGGSSASKVGSAEAFARGADFAAPYSARGTPWPQPQQYLSVPQFMDVNNLQFVASGYSCEILDNAFDRYTEIIFGDSKSKYYQSRAKPYDPTPGNSGGSTGTVQSLNVNVMSPCEQFPSERSDESYKLSVNSKSADLTSASIWGALRGLETFSQLIWELPDRPGHYYVNVTTIADFPRFPYRGLLLDTSRHFLHPGFIRQTLDLMAMNKMNVFHWHIVDDPSFPYQSREFPDLSDKGAFYPYTHVYDRSTIAELVDYARMRGIRIIPEFDSPGHTQSWGKGQPDLLTECYSAAGVKTGAYGPVDPTKNSTYDFMKKLLAEVFTVFPDKSIHLGGDEVSFSCWKSSPVINAWMKKMNISGDYAKLESYYVQKVLDLVTEISPDHNTLVWQEVFLNNVTLRPNTLVQVWAGDYDSYLGKVTKAGYQAILSACWYLDLISYGQDWERYYVCDPQMFNGTAAQKELVVGGEACVWGEYVDGTNVISRTWPRASAVAERLWSASGVNSTAQARDRLEVHRCRMLQRGYSVEPLFISACPHIVVKP